MALFGSKKKGDAAIAPPSTVAGTPAATPAPASTKVVKEKRARPAKSALKNGVITGLNIGNASIKAVEVTAKSGQLSVTRLASIPTPPDAFQNGNVLSVTALSNAIKALWKNGGFKGKAVISSVAGTGALVVRVIEVPLMTDAQLADAMRADAQLYIPFPPTEVQMDFKALRELPSDPDAGTMDVLLAAAQSEIIDLHIKTLQAARLDPRAVDVEPIAAGRALALQQRANAGGAPIDYNEISAIANIGAFGTEISLLRGDVLVFTRTISAGGNSISQTIADALGVPLSEGERLKVEQGDALAPEGYGAGASDDFGFGGDFGAPATGFGGDFDDFGLGDTPAASPTSNATTVLDAPASTAPSRDPFDLDFFNQGPKNEPGAGHGQKEGEPPAGGFSFDDLSLLPEPQQHAPSETTPSTSAQATSAPAPEAPAPEASSGARVPTFNFDFDLPPQDLPTQETAVPAPVTPLVPAPVAPVTRAAMPGELSIPGDLLPPTAGRVAPPIAAMPSAFDFSDFDLPTVEAAPTAPTPANAPTVVSSSPVISTAFEAPISEPATVAAPAPASPMGFSFDEPSEAFSGTIPTSSAQSTSQTVFGSANLPAVAAPLDAGFDLDTVFGAPEPPVTTEAAPGVSPLQPLLEPGTVTHVATVSSSGSAVAPAPLDMAATPIAPTTEGLGLQGLNIGEGAFDFGGASNDIGDFGAGLSGGTEAGGDSLYGALAPALEELASEISRSLSFYLERVPDAALSRIYLTGGGAMMKNLDVYLTGRLGAPTSVFNPLQLLPVSAPASPLTTAGPIYTVALGLALRDFVD